MLNPLLVSYRMILVATLPTAHFCVYFFAFCFPSICTAVVLFYQCMLLWWFHSDRWLNPTTTTLLIPLLKGKGGEKWCIEEGCNKDIYLKGKVEVQSGSGLLFDAFGTFFQLKMNASPESRKLMCKLILLEHMGSIAMGLDMRRTGPP